MTHRIRVLGHVVPRQPWRNASVIAPLDATWVYELPFMQQAMELQAGSVVHLLVRGFSQAGRHGADVLQSP